MENRRPARTTTPDRAAEETRRGRRQEETTRDVRGVDTELAATPILSAVATYAPDLSRFPPVARNCYERTQELNTELDAITEVTHARFRGLLKRLEGMSFKADEEGYRASIALLDAIQRLADRASLVLISDDTPVFLIRSLPPARIRGSVAIQLRSFSDGGTLESCATFPQLKALANIDVDDGIAMFELARHRRLEQFRVLVADLAGNKPQSRDEANALISQVNQVRRQFGAAFAIPSEQGDDLTRVILQYSNGSFQLRTTDRSRTHLQSGPVFPDLVVVDAPA